MSYFTRGSFVTDYVTHNAENPFELKVNVNNSCITLNIIDFLNNLDKELKISQDRHGRPQFMHETIPTNYFFLIGSSYNRNKRHYLMPFLETVSDLTDYLDVNGEYPKLIKLFNVYDYKIREENLMELRKELLSYESLSRGHIKDSPEADFIECLEKVFELRNARLTSSTVGTNMSMAEQREGIIHAILYTLSVVYGNPNLFFYKNIPSEWRHSKTFNSIVYHFVGHMVKIQFLKTMPRRLGDMVMTITQNMDTLWLKHHKPYEDAIASIPSEGGLVCISRDTELHYFKDIGRFGVKYNNDEILMINDVADVENLVSTIPEYVPLVLGKGHLVSLCNLDNQIMLKRPASVGDSIVLSIGSEDDKSDADKLVMKMLTSCNTVFDIMQIMTEFVFSRVVHSHPMLQTAKAAIPYVYAIRDDIGYVNGLFKHTLSAYPTAIIMEKKKGKTLHSVCKKLNRSEMLLILFNLFCICRDLYKAIEFTHYDLHTANIIVDMETYNVSIIDTSRCRFKTDGIWLGSYFNEITRAYVGIIPEKAYPANDIFRILLYCYDLGHTYLDTIISEIFFMNANEIVQIYRESLYSLPYLDKFKDIQYEDVVEIIKRISDKDRKEDGN
jgi:hypothetical protein